MAMPDAVVWRCSSSGRTGVRIASQPASEFCDRAFAGETCAAPASEEAASPAGERKR